MGLQGKSDLKLKLKLWGRGRGGRIALNFGGGELGANPGAPFWQDQWAIFIECGRKTL